MYVSLGSTSDHIRQVATLHMLRKWSCIKRTLDRAQGVAVDRFCCRTTCFKNIKLKLFQLKEPIRFLHTEVVRHEGSSREHGSRLIYIQSNL